MISSNVENNITHLTLNELLSDNDDKSNHLLIAYSLIYVFFSSS